MLHGCYATFKVFSQSNALLAFPYRFHIHNHLDKVGQDGQFM